MAALVSGCGVSTLQPSEAPVMKAEIDEPEPVVQAQAPAPSPAQAASPAAPPGEMEVSFTEAAPPPAPEAPTPKKGFNAPKIVKRSGVVASPAKSE